MGFPSIQFDPPSITPFTLLRSTAVNFINDIVFIFCLNLWIYKAVYAKIKADIILWDLSIRPSFSIVPSTHDKFILIWSLFFGYLCLAFVAVKYQETLLLHYFLHESEVNILMKIADVMEKVFQVRTFKNKCHQQIFSNLLKSAVPLCCNLFMSLHINFWCSWRCWSSQCNAINLLVKHKIKSVPSGC